MDEGFWILQTHREQYDPDLSAPEVGAEDLWAVWKRPGEMIDRGSKVALYAMGGERKGIFAFGKVVSGPRSILPGDRFDSPAAVTVRSGFQAEYAVRVRYDRILPQPISHAALTDQFGRELQIVRNVQRLNYQVSRDEWDELNAMSSDS